LPLVVGDAGPDAGRVQDDVDTRLARGADRDPAQPVVADVAPHLETEGVAVEGQRRFRIVLREEAGVDADVCAVHGDHARWGSGTRASRFLTGLVTCFATHDGIPAVACA